MVIGPKSGATNVPYRPKFEHEGTHALFIWCFPKPNVVVWPHSPVNFPQPHSVLLLGHLHTTIDSLHSLSDVPDPLIGPIQESNVDGHLRSSFPVAVFGSFASRLSRTYPMVARLA